MITSLLDTDFYKFTMGDFAFKRYPDVEVKYRLIDRNKQGLAKDIRLSRLINSLEWLRTLKFTRTEIHYLRGTNEYQERMFDEDFLTFLTNLRLPSYDLSEDDEGNFVLEISGKWCETIYWETLIMSEISELYFKLGNECLHPLYSGLDYSNGMIKFAKKRAFLEANPTINVADFGTRRRYSYNWQDFCIENLYDLPNFVGTSNTYLAMKYGLPPIGTNAHETNMLYAALMNDDLCNSSNAMFDDWWDQYGYGLSIALTDTWGNDFFFKSFGEERAKEWKGVRHDSGDPFKFGRDTIAWYKSFGIDSKEKMLIFSDGLNSEMIFKLHKEFGDQIKLSFGWGTDLTNDMGKKALNIVVKLVEVNGVPTVKLSDNPGKALGPVDEVARYREAFGVSI